MRRDYPGPVLSFLVACALAANAAETNPPSPTLALNDLEYLEMPGLNVMLAHDFYPEGHQGGVGVIQNGMRIATNGDIRLEPTPGQWEPVPKVGKRVIDRATGEISVRMEYPDPEKNRKGFNPVIYPDLNFAYVVRVRPEGAAFRIIVDLDAPLPDAWIGKVGFNFELFPGVLYGKSFVSGDTIGIFPRQPDGPGAYDDEKRFQIAPLAVGRRLLIAGESEEQRMMIETREGDTLQLLDGRAQHNNGWFVVRSLVARGATKGAINWLVSPHAIPNWKSAPVVQVSQVGYHPAQQKIAVVELDARDDSKFPITLQRVSENGGLETVLEQPAKEWGKFLRYRYLQLDFTAVKRPGMYIVRYGTTQSAIFQISADVYRRGVWQPTIDTFLPVQMCHMRINDRYRVWHNWCHLDDARMAPVNLNYLDGYVQGPSTLTKFQPGEHVPGLDHGGWHDAGDHDIVMESQSHTIHGLSLAYEIFDLSYDNTTIDQTNRVVELNRPDGKPDILQQIEHGALTIVGGYNALGRLFKGIVASTQRQYVFLGDPAGTTDGVPFVAPATGSVPAVGLPGSPDDNWVFTEENPQRDLDVAASLAATSRALRTFNPSLSADCLRIAKELWDVAKEKTPLQRVDAAVELLITSGDARYADFLKKNATAIAERIDRLGWIVGRSVPLVNDPSYRTTIETAVRGYRTKVDELGRKTPYGLPYEPAIWGAGWGIQHFGVEQYFLHASFPEIFPDTYMLHALNFILGCHPGSNTASFASGVGAKSLTTAYGINRADESYIPGGIGSGTALIRPDFPELLTWPYLWQQTEYVLGGGTTDYLFLVLAAEKLLGK